jgi:hypothetical protein
MQILAQTRGHNLYGRTKPPPRVKFFAWLLSQERIQCKTVLKKKHIVESTVCEVCQAEETPAHIIFGCPSTKQFWEVLQIQKDANWPLQALREFPSPPHFPAKYFTTFLLLCCWHIWKRRNNITFRNDWTTLNATLVARETEAYLWGLNCHEMIGPLLHHCSLQ